jgi:uncharacterized protein (DUF1330 family)
MNLFEKIHLKKGVNLINMSAYFFFDVQEITDENKMNEYRRGVFETVEKFNGKYRVIGGEQTVLEGDWKPSFPVIIEFENVAAARRWYDSPEYRDLKALRLSATKGSMVLIDGDVRPLG